MCFYKSVCDNEHHRVELCLALPCDEAKAGRSCLTLTMSKNSTFEERESAICRKCNEFSLTGANILGTDKELIFYANGGMDLESRLSLCLDKDPLSQCFELNYFSDFRPVREIKDEEGKVLGRVIGVESESGEMVLRRWLLGDLSIYDEKGGSDDDEFDDDESEDDTQDLMDLEDDDMEQLWMEKQEFEEDEGLLVVLREQLRLARDNEILAKAINELHFVERGVEEGVEMYAGGDDMDI